MTTEQLKSKNIVIQGAREHNLKNIDVTIPRNKLVVVTGVSGSGKSTLAFDTIYAEGQRRYVESLSSYARQFLGRMDKPDVDYIEGLSPAISIDQKGTSHNPRSTVGTVTEIYDYLRLLFARIGKPHCHNCGRPVKSQTVQQIVDSILNIEKDKRIQILAPVVQRRKGEHKDILASARKSGFIRVRVNGEIRDLSESIELDKQKWHNIEIVVDRLVVNKSIDKTRVSDSTEAALKQANGIVLIDVENSEDLLFSEAFACVHCQISLGELEPRNFSYNNPHGACSTCAGLGFKKVVDPELIIPDYSISINNGGIEAWSMSGKLNPFFSSQINALSEMEGFRTDIPINQLDQKHIDLILFGSEKETKIKVTHRTRRGRRFQWNTKFEGVIKNLEKRLQQTESENVRAFIDRFMTSLPCNSCDGNKLKPETLAVTIDQKNIIEISNFSIEDSLNWVNTLSNSSILSSRDQTIASQILKEIQSRLEFLLNVGLDYLSLSRRASTLSGGESQRIRLATQIGSGLMGVLYVCDEPSIGLHPADDDRLITTLKNLRDVGNTVLIVEHDEAIMRSADHIIDMGPGAGEFGGEIIASGTLNQIIKSKKSLTGQYLSGTKQIKAPSKRRKSNGKTIKILGAEENNLRNIDCEIPLGILVCVTGVSGSGKSTLINEILFKKLSQHFYKSKDRPGKFQDISGTENIDKIVNISQAPIGRTPRSNPATYTGAFTYIREVFSQTTEARSRGYKPGRFSFNVKGGRCEACRGDGVINIEMQFLPDVSVPCEECQGSRYNREALQIQYKSSTIAEILSSTVTEAIQTFENIPRIKNKLQTLHDVGLGYIRLGQPATQLSGGEAQRVKLATELAKKSTGNTLYILDEPTTGLSFEDCAQLLRVLQRLVDSGNSVILIEHHLDLIKSSDWLIDLGPGAGNKGGQIVCTGTPEEVAKNSDSKTGFYLKSLPDL
ncbi:MAG: excinuclease ABC subunit UvrA [Dehalococcoidia bacterium]